MCVQCACAMCMAVLPAVVSVRAPQYSQCIKITLHILPDVTAVLIESIRLLSTDVHGEVVFSQNFFFYNLSTMQCDQIHFLVQVR